MNLRKVQDADLNEKKVLVRVDFNVSLDESGDVKEEFKIAAAKETVEYILSQRGKVALVSHFGRPGGEAKEEFSLEQLVNDVERILGVKIKFVGDCLDENIGDELETLQDDEVLLLENVRFYAEEESNNAEFSKKLAVPFDVFVGEAFSVCHRDQASVTGVAKILPSYAGLWLQREVENLEKLRNNPEHPAVAIIGGAKIETKLPLIHKFEENFDYILVGGKIANEAIDQKIEFGKKVIFPVDFATDRLDIGKQTVANFRQIISDAKTIVWNGPMGKFEEKPYDNGTNEILDAVANSKAFTLTGGGESVEVLEEKGMTDEISFVSTGGGAMLEFLSGEPMPGLEVLTK
ncbi:MAG: phosphoglycerate kinase [Candidatus Moranbacteria bacterium]|jgi:phosphoglycerate kinase|nr:phosphoglycerate kinase [Candidatus Moranbacteria bacterium]